MSEQSSRRRNAPAAATTTQAQAQAQAQAQTGQSSGAAQRVLRLRGETAATGRSVQWAEDVVDNEGLGRKSSKVCCIYHKPRAVDESSDDGSSSSSSSDSDSDSDSDSEAAESGDERGGREKTPACGHGRRCGGGHAAGEQKKKTATTTTTQATTTMKNQKKKKRRERAPSPNAYEKVPRQRGGAS
ncbi:hypothetical protein E4U41_006877 [Claviceps citrina]|nr:hypothetical protein E4U41_006877 [Claviceps citrina]